MIKKLVKLSSLRGVKRRSNLFYYWIASGKALAMTVWVSILFLLPAICVASPNSAFLKFSPSQFSQNNEIVIERWNSAEGIKRLNDSDYKNDFYQLAGFFQPQINPLYCAAASSVMILNAINAPKNNIKSQKILEKIKPSVIGGGVIPFNSYSQLTFFDEKTDKIKNRQIIDLKNLDDPKETIDPGLKLAELAVILDKIYKLNVKIIYVDDISQNEIADFRKLLKKILADQNHFIIVNFDGSKIGLKTNGHMSPLAAYDQNSDSVLVLDVAGHKNPWYWVKLEDLYQAMNSKDGEKNRGFLIIKN